MSITIRLTFIFLLSSVSISALSQDVAAIKQMMQQQIVASCNDQAFLNCAGISKNKCMSSTTRAMSGCDRLFPKNMNGMTDTAMNAFGECVSENLLKNSGISANKLDTCSPRDGAPPINESQIMEQLAQTAGAGNHLSGRPYAGSNNFDNPEVIKKYAELVYHVAKNLSSHRRLPTTDIDEKKCVYGGTVSTSEMGRSKRYVYSNCHDSDFELPITNGVIIVHQINDDVQVNELKNTVMSFEESKKGYTIDGKIKVTESAIDTIITNVDEISFTYNLTNEIWQHTVTDLIYSKAYPEDAKIETAEIFKISLSGKLYNNISAETIEPIRNGYSEDENQQSRETLTGKFKLSKGNSSAIITFVGTREILIERTGKKPVKIDWYGDPTTIYWEIPLALKY